MPQIVELGPLTMSREGDRCRFTLSAPDQMTLNLPRDYQQHLSEKLGDLLAENAEISITFDLEDLPGISSRQLGVMLALRKALRARCERLPLTGVSPGVQRLLAVTRTDQFFEIE
ncbi:MAG: STAS domain-containing protein [Planctomycetes bacterium]|nr:STAS domain-containing protein [Planctomycetota bacterium]